MILDARSLDAKELFLRMRNLLAEHVGQEVSVEVFLSGEKDMKRLRAFVSMSGCQTIVVQKEGYYIVRITGSVCCA
jgi:hypothetical protein